MTDFEPTAEALLARLDAVDPAAYARTRNALDGAVTRLSPWLTHGLLDVPDALATIRTRHRRSPGGRASGAALNAGDPRVPGAARRRRRPRLVIRLRSRTWSRSHRASLGTPSRRRALRRPA